MKNIDSITKCSDLCCIEFIFISKKLWNTSIVKCMKPASTPIVSDWNTSDNTIK